jgi:hypothetical protein
MTDELFLLDPKNRDVATGNAPYKGDELESFLICLILFFAMLISCGFVSFNELNEFFRLSSAGVITSATVVDRYTRESDDSTNYYIVYEFRYSKPDGEPVVQRDKDRVSFDKYERLEPGMQIEVFYDPNDPTISALQHPNIFDLVLRSSFSFLWLGLVAFLLLVVISFASFIGGRRFARHGQLIYGTLTSISGDTDEDDDFIIDMHYQFTTPDGRTLQKREQLTRNDLKDKPLPPVGTRIAIWYMDTKTYKTL